MNQLTTQFTSKNYRDPKRQRLYLKDIDCPDEWARDLKRIVPEVFYYLNECIESKTDGDGSILEPNEYGQMRYGKGVAPAGDLMSSLPLEMRALNMMCYIGHEGTYTPAHREMCASLGHNIMVETSKDGSGEKAGTSIWFMTETKEHEVVSEYFLSMLGHDIEVEKHFAQINAWKKAPFNVWVVEQKLGDLVLIPPLAPHQVWNRGTRTMKAAWNRTTVDTLELAINEALPRARMVCREEQYKNKAIVYYTLIKYHDLVTRDTVEQKMWKYGRVKQLFEDFKRLFALYTNILVSEMFSATLPAEKDVEFLEYDSNVTCSYCRCNIWNRFLTCKTCIETAPGGEEDTYDICMDCYAMGRSCGCISNLTWVDQWKWPSLIQNYESWRQTVVKYDGYFNLQTSPQPLEIARKRFGRKPVAQICQEQLKLRPWQNIKNPVPRSPSPGMSSDEPDVDDEGRLKTKRRAKKARGRLTAKKGKTHNCHVCYHHHENWKQAFCTTCNNSYCYGVLWRAFDLMPQQVMEDRDWSCPKCLQICSCGRCRKSDDQTPYSPKGTLLGHDTKKVADFRSVESLVDFSKTNLGWLRGENDDHPQESARMKKLREKAEAEKNREDVIGENYLIDDGGAHIGNEQGEPQDYPQFDNMEGIDPELRDHASSSMPESNGNGTGHYENLYTATQTDMNGADHGDADGDSRENYDWLHGYYDSEEIDAFNRGAGSPSRLLVPVAPIQASTPAVAPTQEAEPESEQFYPDPPQGQTRIMGIGYYPQGAGVDKIAYDPPSFDPANDDILDLTSPASNPNPALSDLLPPEETRPTKKRRLGHRNDNDGDFEFSRSKRARKLAKEKKHSGIAAKVEASPDPGDSHSKAPVPRRSIPKPKTYIDLGEVAMPFTEDEMLPAHQKGARPDGDVPLAAQAMRRLLNNTDSDKGLSSKRRRTRGPAASITPSIAPMQAKVTRKLAWLARKEAEEADEGLPGELPKKKRGRPRRLSSGKSEDATAIDISPGRGSDNEGGVRINANDSLFGNSDAGENHSDSSVFAELKKSHMRNSSEGSVFADSKRPGARNISDESIQWRVSGKTPKVQVAGPPSDSEDEQQVEEPPPKRRGRPPKRTPASSAAKPSPHAPPGTTKFLSLKEKLAPKGKGFKIVAKKPPKSIESPAATPTVPTSRSTPSIVIPRAAADITPLVGPAGVVGWNSINRPSTFATNTLLEGLEDSAVEGSPKDFQGENSFNSVSIVSRYNGADSPPPENRFSRPSTINGYDGHDSSLPEESFNRDPKIIRKDSPEVPQVVKLSNGASSMSKHVLKLVKKGPTTVRLENPSDESYASERSVTRDPSSSSEDDDDELPAGQHSPKLPRGGGSLRGRGRDLSNRIRPGMARRGRPLKCHLGTLRMENLA